MKMKIRDFIHENTDIDVCDDYTEECYIAFCGPMWLTTEGEKEFADALDLEVEIRPHSDLVTILVDDPDEAKAERNLKAISHLFYAMAGYDATEEEYERWFLEDEPEKEDRKWKGTVEICVVLEIEDIVACHEDKAGAIAETIAESVVSDHVHEMERKEEGLYAPSWGVRCVNVEPYTEGE